MNEKEHLPSLPAHHYHSRVREDRSFYRLHEPFTLRFTLEQETGDITHSVQGLDISGGGAKFSSSLSLVPEKRYPVTILMDHEFCPIDCKARVAFCKPSAEGGFEIGVNFENMSEENMDNLLIYIGNKRIQKS